jgi:hypothetical protein
MTFDSDREPQISEKTVTFDFEAGRFVKDKIIGELERACFKADVKCVYKESNGFLESDFTVRLTGTKDRVNGVLRWWNAWMEQLHADEES